MVGGADPGIFVKCGGGGDGERSNLRRKFDKQKIKPPNKQANKQTYEGSEGGKQTNIRRVGGYSFLELYGCN